ncbi:hypothetical protein [Polaromonas sp.]|uniref:hypothetical protein n=1 Tax=Polaromonas sp. TaxID=1869339 RepID=UPI00352B394F
MPHASYSDRYCAFIDFLGFANAVNSGEWTPDQVVASLRKAQQVSGGDEDLISVTQFSDSIVLSAPATDDWAFLSVLSTTTFLIMELAAHGILLRGGLTRGDLYHEQNIAFGPAFIKAYQLEQTAGAPRVILDKDIEKTATWPESMSKNEISGFLKNSIPKDFDGWRYVDYFSASLMTNFDDGPDGLESHYLQLRSLVRKHKDTMVPSLISKYGWLDAKLKAVRK